MNEKETIMVLKALGADEITSKTQKKNGTSMWRLKTGETVAEYSSGYVRKIIYDNHYNGKRFQSTCWQLNPTETHEQSYTSPFNGETYNYKTRDRIMLWTREERLEYLVKYASKKVNKQWEKIKNFETL
ncbi:MAG TPA: hypothetical protein QF851_02450 [Flavobacteriales bacterium]|nr:hypothetical protein [Flavobacteriales bacterium]